MPATQLNLSDLSKLHDGLVVVAFDHELRQAVMDIGDRPADKTVRQVILRVLLEPQLDKDTGKLDTVGVTFKCDHTKPKRSTVQYPMLATADGQLLFQEGSPMNPRQLDLFPRTETASPDPKST